MSDQGAFAANSLTVGAQTVGAQTAPHQIPVCLSCRHKDSHCRSGLELLEKLRIAVVGAAGLRNSFEVSGTACMAGCDRPCMVAWRANGKATRLFGDISPDQDIEALVEFANLYQSLEDGWCRAADRPDKLARSALARIPAAMIVTGPRIGTLQ